MGNNQTSHMGIFERSGIGMATQTTNYGLTLPNYDEMADIDVINENMDLIDAQMKKNADGVGQAKSIVSDAYSGSSTYNVGDYCIYDNKLYRCITAVTTAESFDSAKWKETSVKSELSTLNSNINTIESNSYIHEITSTTSILELFKFQKADTIQSYFMGSYTLLTDYPASLINEQGTVYPFVTIERPRGVGYIRITAVTAGGTPKQITGYTNADADFIIWGNVL